MTTQSTDGVRIVALAQCRVSHPTNPCDEPCDACWQEAERVVEMFGGTFHAFNAWLATRPDLADAGSARQLDAYAAHEQRQRAMDEIERITRDISREG